MPFYPTTRPGNKVQPEQVSQPNTTWWMRHFLHSKGLNIAWKSEQRIYTSPQEMSC